jgi:hypothetical protein
MLKEIKRSSWSTFCKKFSVDNRYRQINVLIRGDDNGKEALALNAPFMGLALEKKGRFIDGVLLYSGWPDAEHVTRPLISFKEPDRIMLEKDDDGHDRRLTVFTKESVEATIELTGVNDPNLVVEKVAYSIYEQRGHSHGFDSGDWFEAERRVKEAEATLV